MEEKIMLTKKFTLVGMGDVQISTPEKPIIGTEALATCVGVLLYSEREKRAIVAHVSSDPMPVLKKMATIMKENGLLREPFKCMIIYGTDREAPLYNGVVDVLKRHFWEYAPLDNVELSDSSIRIDMETMSREFAFDASVGKFVTDKVLFGTNYILVNGEEYIENTSKAKQK